jgi:hypothetical protein
MDPITQCKTVYEFKNILLKIGWFLNIGQQCNASYIIKDWYEWRGPEDPPTLALAKWTQEVYDKIFQIAVDKKAELTKLWEDIHEIVLKTARTNINDETNQDAWHAPSQAPWDAAFISSLVAVYLNLNIEMPLELIIVWDWYVKGHWPCSYAVRSKEEGEIFFNWYRNGFPEGQMIKYMEENKPEYMIY